MEQFVSDSSKKLWDMFANTGDVGVYMLYSAVQHTPDHVLDKWENYDNQKAEGLEF